ncbi:MAG: transporter substrate-binding domain-containing protein, partial [Sutterella sp.]|nr:transporter substrate-binding domain-containing protein [Sutterella sp.]
NSGKYVGFDIDLIDEVAKRAGFEPQILSMGLDGLIPALMSGSIDVAVPPSRLRRSVPPRSTSRSRTMNLGFPLWPARTMLPSRA